MVRFKNEEREQTMGQTRLKLLEAAAVEFARAGYADANINAISTGAGFAKGTIYNYFPSKQALLLALIDETAQQHFDFIHSQVLVEVQPARRLERFFQAGFEFVVSNLAQAQVVFNTLNGADESLKEHVFAAYQPFFQFVAVEILAPGIAQGVFRPVDTPSMAMLLMTIYLGTASQHNPQGRPWLDPLQVVGLVLNGLRP